MFNDDRYFDVFVEYAKGGGAGFGDQDQRGEPGAGGGDAASSADGVVRNTWMWSDAGSKPTLNGEQKKGFGVISAHHTDPIFHESLADYSLYCEGDAPLLFTENESNNEKLFGTKSASPYVKDAFHNLLIHGQKEAVNPALEGTKAAPHYVLTVGPGETKAVRLRLVRTDAGKETKPFAKFDEVFAARLKEADEFYGEVMPPKVKADPDRRW